MTKKYVVECDLCGTYCEEHETYILEIRPDLAPGQSGDVEKMDICPECKQILLDFIKSRTEPCVPEVNVNVPRPNFIKIDGAIL